jgi:hypothetical protein
VQIQSALIHKLPDAIGPEQKRNKIRNLVQDLVRDDIIVNVGKHGRARPPAASSVIAGGF